VCSLVMHGAGKESVNYSKTYSFMFQTESRSYKGNCAKAATLSLYIFQYTLFS